MLCPQQNHSTCEWYSGWLEEKYDAVSRGVSTVRAGGGTLCIPDVNSNQRHAVHMLCKCYRVQWSEGSGRDRESKKSGRCESLNAHFSETAESYGLLKRLPVEYVLICTFYKSPHTPKHVRASWVFPHTRSNLSASELCCQVLYEFQDKCIWLC